MAHPSQASDELADLPLRPADELEDDEHDEHDAPTTLAFDPLEDPDDVPAADDLAEDDLAADDPDDGEVLAEDDLAEDDLAEDEVLSDIEAAGEPSSGPEAGLPASLGERFASGLADLGVVLFLLGGAVAGTFWLGIEPGLDDWPPFAVLGLVISFLYWFIPLAFWGQTPGMAWRGHLALSHDEAPLAFGQTTLRWVGALLTAGLAGLPLLLALTGRSLSDRLSDSKTVTG